MHILNALKCVYKCCCARLLIAACFPIHHPTRRVKVSRNRPRFDKHYTIKYSVRVCVRVWMWLTSLALFLFLYASCSSLLQMKPPFCCSPLLSSRPLLLPLIVLLLPVVISALPASLAFGCDVWGRGERSRGPGVPELASTGPAAPLPLSPLLLIWHRESTFCSIVLSMN